MHLCNLSYIAMTPLHQRQKISFQPWSHQKTPNNSVEPKSFSNSCYMSLDYLMRHLHIRDIIINLSEKVWIFVFDINWSQITKLRSTKRTFPNLFCKLCFKKGHQAELNRLTSFMYHFWCTGAGM